MHRYGLKLWSTNVDLMDEIQNLFDQRLFDYIELYVVPKSLTGGLECWSRLDIPIVLHAPHSYSGLNFSLKQKERENEVLVKETEAFREVLSPNIVIFHPGIEGSLSETIRQINQLSGKYKKLFEVSVIENKPHWGLKGERCVGSTPDEIKQILSATGMGFCFDIGHAIYSAAVLQYDLRVMINEFMSINPSIYHLSDGNVNSKTDMHLSLGRGTFPLNRLIQMIPEGARITIETEKDLGKELEDYNADVCYIKKLTKDNLNKIRLEQVEMDDREKIWEWANDPDVRGLSFSSKSIPWDEHCEWFDAKRRDSKCHMYIAKNRDGIPVGQVRIDDSEEGGVVSISVDSKFRSKGYGKDIIRASAREYFRNVSNEVLNAYIVEENKASQRAFKEAGFVRKDEKIINGRRAQHYILGRR